MRARQEAEQHALANIAYAVNGNVSFSHLDYQKMSFCDSPISGINIDNDLSIKSFHHTKRLWFI